MFNTLENQVQNVRYPANDYYFQYPAPSTCPGCGRCNTCGRGGHETPYQVPYTQSYLSPMSPFLYSYTTRLASSTISKADTTLNPQTNSIGVQLDGSSNPMEDR